LAYDSGFGIIVRPLPAAVPRFTSRTFWQSLDHGTDMLVTRLIPTVIFLAHFIPFTGDNLTKLLKIVVHIPIKNDDV